ncbi:uncharacterized protein LOC109937756 [Rhincodon typus]|uniref:uncharacterized protein LOC109937756 n=1 Tax=Rhincodon typus TaxID=259920 RepID=UPI00202DC621|nr:uncharacterized protein LOC109937756 [Rhincodon typus]
MSLKTSHLFFFDQASYRNFKKPRKQPGKKDFEALTPPKGQQTVNLARSPQKTKKRLPASAVLTEQKAVDVAQARNRPGSGASVLNVFISSLADEVEHVQYFENLQAATPFLLTEIDGMILHCKIAGIPFPRGLENILNYSWNDLINDVSYKRKQWPTAACKRTCVPKKPPQKLSRAHGSVTSASTITNSSRTRTRSAPISEELKEKPNIKVNQRHVSRSTVKGFTINFSVSSKACLDQGWIIKPYDETIAKLNWREIYTLMLEKLQVENTKINFEKSVMMKYGFDKPVILLHYEEAKIEPRFRKYMAMPEMPLVKDGIPLIPNLKVENPALSKLHYALNDGSAII